jgi:hypothetical protein
MPSPNNKTLKVSKNDKIAQLAAKAAEKAAAEKAKKNAKKNTKKNKPSAAATYSSAAALKKAAANSAKAANNAKARANAAEEARLAEKAASKGMTIPQYRLYLKKKETARALSYMGGPSVGNAQRNAFAKSVAKAEGYN